MAPLAPPGYAYVANVAAMYSADVKAIRNSNYKHVFVLLVQILKQRFT